MKPAPFDYHRPSSVAEAVALLGTFGDGAKLLAGGQSLVPMLALRLATFDHLIDIGRISELNGIVAEPGRLRVGAGTTQATIERSSTVAAAVPLLARATPLIGHFQIRNRGTIGGSLAHADPAAEYPAVALALDAEFEIEGPRGHRSVNASEFFRGRWSSAVADDEVLTSIAFPVRAGRWGFAIREFARRHGDFAIAGAAVAIEVGDHTVRRAAIAVFGLGPAATRAGVAEAAASGAPIGTVTPQEVGELAVSGLEQIPSDLHGSGEYRRRVGAAVTAAAWQEALEEALGG